MGHVIGRESMVRYVFLPQSALPWQLHLQKAPLLLITALSFVAFSVLYHNQKLFIYLLFIASSW